MEIEIMGSEPSSSVHFVVSPLNDATLDEQDRNEHQRKCSFLSSHSISCNDPTLKTTTLAPPEEKEHRCRWNGCNKSFQQLEEMVSHVNDHAHMEDEAYTCRWDGCNRGGRGFNARYKMLIHMRTHTNERPHHCLTCGKCFSRLENLKIHTRSHTGEKPYICSVEGCNKAYSNSSDRFKHTRTHFVDKPFVCKKDGCDKRYTDPSSLRKHMKTYGHREEKQAKRSSSTVTEHTNSLAVNSCINSMLFMATTPMIPEPKALSSSIGTVFVKPEKQPLWEMDLRALLPNSSHFLSNGMMHEIPTIQADCFFKTQTCVKNRNLKELKMKCQAGPLDLTVNNSDGEHSMVYAMQWGSTDKIT